MTTIDLEKAYDHSKVEDKIYKQWLDSGFFNPDNLPDASSREPFTVSLPPPNVTGTLHLGHAFEDTIQDAVIRFQRMQGKRALWLPGTDHAAIATQAKFEKEHYKKEGKSRHDYSRQEFFEMIQKFALENQKNILSQLHKLGLSLDWSRLAFTLDKDRELAVRTAFKQMYDAGLIYRAHRVVNWDPKGQTTVSDDEIEHEEAKAKLYTFTYSKDFPIPIATTRPETKLGDTAVAVHPEGKWKTYIGQEFNVDFIGTPLHIKIIGDKDVDPEFGTGALGVTPAHSMADYEMSLRHNLEIKQVINEFAKITIGGPDIEGKKTAEAREIVAQKLRAAGLLEKEEDITQNLSKAQRTGGVIEPLPKLQWFIAVNKTFTDKSGKQTTLKDVMRDAVASGKIKIMPERFEKTYFHWIDNLRDWCISRQIIYGHQIPVWYKNDQIHVDTNPPKDQGWEQDTDTLDTWFSSGLWTFSTLGWPSSAKASEGEPNDLSIYHPTSVMMPGYEILFFWVARMVLMSGFLLGDVPFHKVYLHGIVRDKQGRKFSKSLNNGIDPLEMTAKYGTDALRMALVFGAAPGNDVIFDEQKVKGMKHFGNKLWNITRFVIDYAKDLDMNVNYSKNDKNIRKYFEDIIINPTTKNLEEFQLHEAAQTIYQYLWHEFADKIIEDSKANKPKTSQIDMIIAHSKTIGQGESPEENGPEFIASRKKLLITILEDSLKLLHPFMPFITEELWSKLQEAGLLKKKDLLMISEWPK